jgi:hypothetical protein
MGKLSGFPLSLFLFSLFPMEKPSPLILTIADYWQSQGFSKEEAQKIERQQIREAPEEDFFDELSDFEDFCGFE